MKTYKYRRILLIALPLFSFLTSHATESGDSVDTYQNHTVSGSVMVQGRTSLTSGNVTVTSTGQLTLSASEGITLNSPFTVDLGGELIMRHDRQYFIRYTYDASGNRVRRENDLVME